MGPRKAHGMFVKPRRARARFAGGAAALAAVAALACASSHGSIPSGTYVSRSGEDYVLVDGEHEHMWFFVKVDERPRSAVGAGRYGYLVRDEGRVHVVLTSVESVRGLANYSYAWNGRELTMRHRTSGEERVFVREAAPGP
jgi:hypothetical protein